MNRCPLFVLPAAVLGTAALSLVSVFGLAQGAATKPQPPAPGHAPVNTPPAPPPLEELGDNTVVGICNDHKVTWGQLVAKMTEDEPRLLQQSVATIVSTKAGDVFFGTPPKESFTITKTEALAELRHHPNESMSQELQLMLTQMAVDDETTKQNAQPTEKQVDDFVANILKRMRTSGRIPKDQSDDKFLAENHTTMAQLEKSYRPTVQVLSLIHKDVVKQLGHPVGPDDMLMASHVLVRVIDTAANAPADEKHKAEVQALARIREIRTEIASKKITFANEAKATSDDEASKSKGGDLGIILRGSTEFGKEFDNAAFSAKVNQMTDPIKSAAGYHLILVTKLGKDIPEKDRATFLDGMEMSRIQPFVQQVVDKDNKIDNKLAALVPRQNPMGFPGSGAPPGAR